MAIDTITPRSRRALLGAGLGAIAASVANAVGRPAVSRAADDDPVLLGNHNSATETTEIETTGLGCIRGARAGSLDRRLPGWD